MNLKISPEHIRFRISADECAMLLSLGVLENVTQLPNMQQLDYVIRTNTAATSQNNRILELISVNTSHGLRLELTVFANGIELLQSEQTQKSGIQEHLDFPPSNLLTVGLEIDLHSKKNSASS